jgi:hypothetical protein
MPANRLLNISGAQFQPDASGTPIPLTGVTGFDFTTNGTIIQGAGDGDLGPSSVNLVAQDPRFTADIEGLAVLTMIWPGLRGTLTFTHMSEKGDGPGSMDYVIANCMVEDTPRSGRFRAYGTGRIQFRTFWPDGQTNPVSIMVRSV